MHVPCSPISSIRCVYMPEMQICLYQQAHCHTQILLLQCYNPEMQLLCHQCTGRCCVQQTNEW
jgi:hypothetical protein